MLQHPMKLFALAALTAAIGAGPAAAGGSACCCTIGCAPVIEVAPRVSEPFYIVNQGPDYSGPGIVLVPGYVEVDTAPATYPYVGRDYYFPSYPYVGHHAKPARYHVHRDHKWHKRHRSHISARRASVKHTRYPD